MNKKKKAQLLRTSNVVLYSELLLLWCFKYCILTLSLDCQQNFSGVADTGPSSAVLAEFKIRVEVSSEISKS